MSLVLEPNRQEEEDNPYLSQFSAHPKNWQTPTRIFDSLSFASERVLDLGCGNGHFLAGYLKTRPSWLAVGVDLRHKRLFKAANKLESFPYAGALREDVREFLRLSPSETWTEVWLQFPDPWPKRRHAKHRMISVETFFHINRILKPGGRFCFRSDCGQYWEQLVALNAQSKLFGVSISQRGDLFEAGPKTLFHNTFTRRGVSLFSIEFRRTH